MSKFNFPPTSRYYGIDTATLTTVDDQTIVYLRRRFVPSPDRFALLQEHVVSEGERMDKVKPDKVILRRTSRSAYLEAVSLARICEVLPLICPLRPRSWARQPRRHISVTAE